jgi:hypothetical protein
MLVDNEQKCLLVNSEHYDWCYNLTSKKNVTLYPRVLRREPSFHEVSVFITPNSAHELKAEDIEDIKMILGNRSDIMSSSIFLKSSNGLKIVLARLVIKHENSNTMTGFLANDFWGSNRLTRKPHSIFDVVQKYILDTSRGFEKWLFIGSAANLDRINSDLLEGGFVKKSYFIPMDKAIEQRAITYQRFFNSLGANKEEAKILSLSKLFGLLNNPTDNALQKRVGAMIGIDEEKVLPILDRGVLKCSPVISLVNKLNAVVKNAQIRKDVREYVS